MRPMWRVPRCEDPNKVSGGIGIHGQEDTSRHVTGLRLQAFQPVGGLHRCESHKSSGMLMGWHAFEGHADPCAQLPMPALPRVPLRLMLLVQPLLLARGAACYGCPDGGRQRESCPGT